MVQQLWMHTDGAQPISWRTRGMPDDWRHVGRGAHEWKHSRYVMGAEMLPGAFGAVSLLRIPDNDLRVHVRAMWVK